MVLEMYTICDSFVLCVLRAVQFRISIYKPDFRANEVSALLIAWQRCIRVLLAVFYVVVRCQ